VSSIVGEGVQLLEPDRESARPSVWRAIMSSIEGRVGVAMGAVMVLLIAVGPLVAPYAPTEIGVTRPFASPSWQHPFGGDNLGRDVFSRFLAGGRGIVIVPIAAALVSLLVGGWLGMLSAYSRAYGRPFADKLINRSFDIAMTLPPLLIVLVLISALGTGTSVTVLVLGIVFAPRVGRLVRGSTEAVVMSDYVAAARARGERRLSILWREITPNIAAPVSADFALRVTYGVLFVATLNFLGVGSQPPDPNWGLSVAEQRQFIAIAPWATVAPIMGIVLVSIPFNLIADAIVRRLAQVDAVNEFL
jgi:peptide/nickel transport system permease protein